MIDLQDIVGQEDAIGRLGRLVSGDRMPHALLLAGPEGVGRRTTAAALAKVLLCADFRPADGASDKPPSACGSCRDCAMMDAGSHPDFTLVYKELAAYHEDANVRGRVMQEMSIEVIRSFLIAPAYQQAARGRGKVFVVLEADLMSDAAQNALLKTLEEPPPGVTILLVTRRPEQLLPTTRSRCAMVRFGLLPREFVRKRLVKADVDEDQAEFWANFTDGSLGRALKLAGTDLYDIKRDLIERIAGLNPAGDSALSEHLSKTVDKLADKTVRAASRDSDVEMSKNLARRQVTGVMLELIAGAFRDAMHLRCGAKPDSDAVGRLAHADQTSAIRAIAGKFTPTELAEILEQLSEYERLLWRNVSSRIVWDNAVIACASAAPLR